MLVLGSYLDNGSFCNILARCYYIQVGGLSIAVSFCQYVLVVAKHLQRPKVRTVVSKLLYLTFLCDGIKVFCSVPNTNEVYHGILRVAPAEVVNIRVKAFCEVSLLSRSEIIHAQAVAVALISVALHAEPCHIPSVRRELWVLVVAYVHVTSLLVDSLVLHGLGSIDGRFLISLRLAEVSGLAGLQVIEIDIRVSRYGIFHAFLLPAGISY